MRNGYIEIHHTDVCAIYREKEICARRNIFGKYKQASPPLVSRFCFVFV